MQDENVPNWSDLSDEERTAVEALTGVAKLCEGFTPDRVVLYYAYLTEMLIATLSARTLAAREMGAQDLQDPRLNVAGMVLSTCMNEIRDGYDTMFDPTALAEINDTVNKQFALVESMIAMQDVSPEQLIAFLKGLEGAVELGEDPQS